MTAKSYSFQVGKFFCMALLDGASILGTQGILKRYPDATEADYRQAYASIGLLLEEADTSFNILLVKTGRETILIDVGQGGRPRGGHLPESMRLAGISPEEVTLVIITHAHGDHVLGLLTPDNQAVFPNATYVMSQKEMVFWQKDLDAADALIMDLMKSKGLRLIAMDEQIVEGISAVPLDGHTDGQIGILLESDGEKLLHLADALHIPIQFAHLEWSPTFDADTNRSVPTRRAALQRSANENLLTLFYHLTFPGLGRVKQGDNGFVWEGVDD